MAQYTGPQGHKLILSDTDIAQFQALNLLTGQGDQQLFKRAVELLKNELIPTTNSPRGRGKPPRPIAARPVITQDVQP
jgi:hypothetical protein